MCKKILCSLLILFFTAINWPSPGAAEDNPAKTTFLVFISELSTTDLKGHGLPNVKKIQAGGAQYEHLTGSAQTPEQSFLNVLGYRNNLLHLPRILAQQNHDCLVVDGSGTLPKKVFQANRVELISTKSDRLSMDKFLEDFSESHYQFVAVYLDDLSQAGGNKSTHFNRWSSADNQLGRLLNYLVNNDKLSQSTIILTGGGQTPPLVMFGAGINTPASYYHCQQQDIAPTVLKINGLTPPKDMQGDILYECLLPTNNQARSANLQNRINSLQKECLLKNQEINQLKNEQQLVQSQKAGIEEERKKVQRIISEKDRQIRLLNTKIWLYKIIGLVLLFILLVGYIVEYRVLRKKFLIF